DSVTVAHKQAVHAGEQPQQDEPEPEGGSRGEEQLERRGETPRSTRPPCGEERERERDDDGHEECRAREQEGRPDLLADRLGDWGPESVRGTEVSRQQPTEVAEALGNERLIQSV